MVKNNTKTIFVCSDCGEEFAKWSGKCLNCGEWNTLREMRIKNKELRSKNNKNNKSAEIVNLDKVECKDFKRISTGTGEFDRVLGGGIVPGTVVLLGGDPGIGKSTLMLQLASNLSREHINIETYKHINIKTQEQNPPLTKCKSGSGSSILYISGEESPQQIKIRADRLGIKATNLQLLAETDVDIIISQISKVKSQSHISNLKSKKLTEANETKKLVIIDSIQTMYDSNYPSTPGSIVQVRECALRLQQLAKSQHISIILVGHVTKEGNVAGPRTLEHLVDVVLYLEGEQYHNTRILRGVKNRFGAVDEIGVFEMTQKGLEELTNPSKLFLAERSENVPGSVVTSTMEGTRPFLVEIQALTSTTNFGYPKRTSSGFDLNRLNLLVAVLQKRAGLKLGNQDIYVNVVGGFKVKDPGVDLAVCTAIASAYLNKPINSKTCLFGEVGLSGEIRTVNFAKKRQEEAKRLGFTKIVQDRYLNAIIKKIFKEIKP